MNNTCKCGEQVPNWLGSICGACLESMSIEVATITVDKAFDYQRGEESAAAYHVIRVEPGCYPIKLYTDTRGRRYLAACFSGVVTSSGYGAKRYRESEGKVDTVYAYPYKYQLRDGKFWGRVEVKDAAAIERAEGV